ncbi:unnamed protein product [Allacma fusca]|uniref:Uncharacterized protein n=1 Tax=Allacma fusca TaxID=39272 RepID=A0A8J2KVR0_9HEXA|nr:unnamed protein product [Allacma fusca]
MAATIIVKPEERRGRIEKLQSKRGYFLIHLYPQQIYQSQIISMITHHPGIIKADTHLDTTTLSVPTTRIEVPTQLSEGTPKSSYHVRVSPQVCMDEGELHP